MEKTQNYIENPLGTKPIKKLLTSFAWPAITANIINAMYSVIDQIFIGQGVGYLGNAATNIAFPITTMCLAIGLTLGIGGASNFNLELGKGFAFVARQKHIRTETQDFFIDLVFYNYILKCFVIVELKTDKITHQDIGQLDMYVRMFDDLEKSETDNPTLGILLCTKTDETIAKYSVLAENKHLFATKYLPFLPTEEELVAEIEREKQILRL